MPILILSLLSCFSITFCKKNQSKKSSKHNFGDGRGDEKQVYYLEWSKLNCTPTVDFTIYLQRRQPTIYSVCTQYRTPSQINVSTWWARRWPRLLCTLWGLSMEYYDYHNRVEPGSARMYVRHLSNSTKLSVRQWFM